MSHPTSAATSKSWPNTGSQRIANCYVGISETSDAEIDERIHIIHLLCDSVSTHHGKEVRKCLAKHPRFAVHFTPVHCSSMNQVEQ
jgi:hypothetical protein